MRPSPQMPTPPASVTPTKPRALPSVEEAWNLPISNEMTNRQNQPRQGGPRAGPPQQPGGVKKEEGVGVGAAQPRPPFYLNQQQLQTLQYLQNQPGRSDWEANYGTGTIRYKMYLLIVCSSRNSFNFFTISYLIQA
jgi:hypothetical protein